MSKFEKELFDNVDISRGELKEIGEAMKKEEFRKLLGDYFNEVTDPKTRALYESEMTQLEKERGVDISFVHPNPGYVIKTSCDGERKAFINICSNDKVGKPVSTSMEQDGQRGTHWTLPHLLVPPRIDMDKKQQRCIIFDAVFHPETIDLANKYTDFKNLVNDTALSGIEDSFNAKLDRNNLRYPKAAFKGSKTASVIRQKCKDIPCSESSETPMDIPNYPFKPVDETPKTKVTNLRSSVPKGTHYTTPKYIIKHRKGMEYHEYSNAMDAKVNAVTPSELIVEIDLPLLSSTSDAKLDVCERSLTLISEKPSKYKLEIALPYAVDEANGSARFDKRSKMLFVTLPVIQKKFEERLFNREDSGIESDINQNPTSSDDDLNERLVEVMRDFNFNGKRQEGSADFRSSEEIVAKFLSEEIHYTYPNYTVNNNDKYFSIVVSEKNVDPTTVYHQFVMEGAGVHFKFASLGSGFFPIHYALCISFPRAAINSSTLKADVWDENVIISFDLFSCEDDVLNKYLVGLTTDNMEEVYLENAVTFKDFTEKFEDFEKGLLAKTIKNKDEVVIDSPKCSKTNLIEIFDKENIGREDIQVDTLCHRVSEVDINAEPYRTDSESNMKSSTNSTFRQPTMLFARRSILKNNRSMSESNTDEYIAWSSMDSSDNQEDGFGNSSTKKTVRFSEVVSKKVFRAGSSILGQKLKNEKKSRNKKKVALKRRRSESDSLDMSEASDISDYSEVSDMSDTSDGGCSSSDDSNGSFVQHPAPIPGSKRHRRRGSKNSRKNAATAKQNNFLFCQD